MPERNIDIEIPNHEQQNTSKSDQDVAHNESNSKGSSE